MIETKDKRVFQVFWGRWQRQLSVLVEAVGGKLLCPGQDNVSFAESDEGFTAQPNSPICLLAIPHKGSSVSSHKLVAFIDGSFAFKKEANEEARLVGVHSNVAFFQPKEEEEGGEKSLTLIDAYHFDHFVADPVGSAPHPIFHVQRNIRLEVVLDAFRRVLTGGTTMTIRDIDQAEKNRLFGLKTFRIPTPQVDLFSLSAILVADHLVGKCSHDSPAYGGFKSFLNFIRSGRPALVTVDHQPTIRAEAATAENRFVWQWYSAH